MTAPSIVVRGATTALTRRTTLRKAFLAPWHQLEARPRPAHGASDGTMGGLIGGVSLALGIVRIASNLDGVEVSLGPAPGGATAGEDRAAEDRLRWPRVLPRAHLALPSRRPPAAAGSPREPRSILDHRKPATRKFASRVLPASNTQHDLPIFGDALRPEMTIDILCSALIAWDDLHCTGAVEWVTDQGDRMAMADGGERAVSPLVRAAQRWIARAQREPRTIYSRLVTP